MNIRKKVALYFHLQENETDLATELTAGLSSFLAIAYVVIVNPLILAQAGMSINGVTTATVLLIVFCTLAMGLYAKNPIVVAPGLGINTFFVYTIVMRLHIPWQEALGATFWSGLIFVILSVLNIRDKILKAIPDSLNIAFAAGLGIFIALIGFTNIDFIKPVGNELLINKINITSVLFLIGLGITFLLLILRVRSAILLGIIVTTLLAFILQQPFATHITQSSVRFIDWKGSVSMPDFSLLWQLDIIHSFRWGLASTIFTLIFTDLFESVTTISSFTEVTPALKEKGENHIKHIKEVMMVDAIATFLSSILGTSPGTPYLESNIGIKAGGRTGLVAVFCALLFIPFLFFAPLLSMVPFVALSPALVVIGLYLMQPFSKINWEQWDESIPCFMGFILVPFSFSLTNGIIAGVLSYVFCKSIAGKRKEISAVMWTIAFFCVLFIILD